MRLPFILMPTVVLLMVLAVVVTEWLVQPSGVSSEECLSCHQISGIGRVTTTGTPIAHEYEWQAQLHEALGKPDCLACHTVHDRQADIFDHRLLKASVRSDCTFCHIDAAPNDSLHSAIDVACGICHSTEIWSNARFDHDVLSISVRNDCASCHLQQAPSDSIHRSAGNNCGACHSTASWSDAVLDHDRFFRFDRRHPATCTDCHLVPGDYSSYSCYGSCHAHNETEMRNKHLEEGIRNYQDCARCHRGGNERD